MAMKSLMEMEGLEEKLDAAFIVFFTCDMLILMFAHLNLYSFPFDIECIHAYICYDKCQDEQGYYSEEDISYFVVYAQCHR